MSLSPGAQPFTGQQLVLPPSTGSPFYAYQKIDESKLKAYTRYAVSMFVAQTDSLDIMVSRYGDEVNRTVNVPYNTKYGSVAKF
ncbi:hypothetical protein CN602_25245, partial [Bacillus cereus]